MFKWEKFGHYRSNCPKNSKQANCTNVIREEDIYDPENRVLYSSLSNEISNKRWVIDNGSSRHIMGYKETLNSLSEKVNDEVAIGDNSAHSVERIGNCTLKLKSGNTLLLKGVHYVAGIKRNLISNIALEDDGHNVAFVDGKVLTWAKNSSIKKAKLIGQRKWYLYELKIEPSWSIQALVHEAANTNEIWHRRLGHLNFKTLSTMEKMVTRLPKLNKDHPSICKRCALGKNTRSPFHDSTRKTNNVLELIHSDLCGPMVVPSLGRFWYYILFIDDFSRKTWIYFLKCKESEEILQRFKEFKTLIENFSEHKIKTLRIDNGGEYTSDLFKRFCKESGIKREYIVPYNPEQNGVAKRKNRTTIEAARAMIFDQNLDYYLWAEACCTVVYIQNRSPHSYLKDKTLKEVFTKVKSNISHLWIFGCPLYIHVPKKKRTKLEPSLGGKVFL